MFGAAIETIVWSMNVIETAKIIAARTRFLGPLPAGNAHPAASVESSSRSPAIASSIGASEPTS